jgi:hypothetical protein
MMIRLSIVVFCAVAVAGDTMAGGEITSPASVRFADPTTTESPDFQQHVIPLLGRLGCNGRACHGSFQGRGGFRLSLFGYDFNMDHGGLTGKATSESGSRIDRGSAQKSLLIQKPSLQVDHEGGERLQQGSWEHHLLRNWIEAGAPSVAAPRELARLAIEPAEVVYTDPAETVQLKVIAFWQDGTREDVTPLCRFRTNDDSVATVNRDGLMTSTGTGDSHVIAFYDNGVAAVPVMRALAELSDDEYPTQVAATQLDRLVLTKLRKLGIVPSTVCSDATFLRRLSIDLTGTLPTPQEIESFLADSSTDKRSRKIDELLERPAYAAWWANKLCDFTGCNPQQQAELGQETSVQWYMWIYARLRENVPYDELIKRIVLAKSRADSQTYDQYAAEVSSYYRDQDAADFADRTTMPHYWSRRALEKPEDKALAFAHNFLGIRLQCAQCHKHPFAPWTQADFQQFSEFFENVKFGVQPETDGRYRQLAKQVGLNLRGNDGSPVRPDVLKHARAGGTLPWREVYIGKRRGPVELNLLRSEVVQLQPHDDPRRSIMRWMEDRSNPWFAKAFVNRVWAGYFNVGIIDPPDDLNPANPPSNPELLDWLAAGFIQHDYDIKWLHRTIVASDTYQRSWQPNETNRDDVRNFSRAIPRRMPAEVVYDAVKQAVAATDMQAEVRTDLTRRAIGHLSMRLAGTYAMHVFGKPERAVNCDCERVNQPTLLQSVFLQNDPLIDQRLQTSGWLDEIAERTGRGEQIDQRQLIRTAWLRTVGRPPADKEIKRAQQHFADAESPSAGVRDLLWALINTKEFILNH